MARSKRTDEEYEIEALSKGLKVLEALEGDPVAVKTVMERTGFNRDVCDRSLKTLRMHGYAGQNPDGRWTLGQRLLKFSGRYSELALLALSKK